ncbi:hybrid sensor histidine kinase/response regulator transcription factor [Parabacteroides goldsteinii]|jgi:signal transduction histidine kinase/AraC-like DNA-binding protein|uniref:hybrid sensor histidine kinase/response regulator transcription factor n=1 Tax=Parabacteroides goldsteinii TaxID=328812 RepID=UPI001E0CB137|nr:substrate-binding domain-containing protein [Parabacteroides goldsteinii]MBS6575147.1 substrate-binding domain-containing protein [Parabacteroides goldsteinii]
MKLIIYRFCLLICILSLTISCKREGEKKFVVGVSHSSINDSWRKAMVLDMQVKASEYPGLTLQIKDAGEDNDTQIKQIREFIKQRVDLVIISANESEPVTTAAVEAFRAGIPTIIIDRKIYSEEYTTFIGADNYEIGRAAGLFINSLLKKRKTTIVEVWGREGSSSARDRHNGFSDALIHNDNVILKTVYGRWHAKETKENIATLGLFDDIDIVYAHNDVMALAAREAIMEIDSLAVKRIKFIGIDALPGKGKGIEAVSNGHLTASFVYPTGGTTAIKVAWQILNGQPVSKQYALTSALIDKDNAGTLYLQTEQLADYQEQIEKQRNNLEEMLSEYRFLQNSVGLILLLLGVVGLLALYVIHIFRKVQRKNHELKRTNIQVEQQREELAVANRKIEQATTRKLQFFTNVSHEIKTPLTLILGPLNKLSKELPPDSPIADDIHIIKKNADRLKRVVSQLLDFRKVESNKMDMRVTEIDLVTFIEDVSSYFDNMAQSKQIQYSFQHDVSSVMLWVDTDKMEKILANLLSNAFKFTPDGGTVTIRLQDHAGYVILSVEDNGKGIQPQNLSSVFDQFFTADHLTGTGIGLHLTHEFVGMHKGSIRVESEPGKRTVFFVELPKGKSHFDESCVFAPSVTELSSGVANLDTREMDEIVNRTYDYTILIVEDDPDINAYLQKELKPNFRILTAENGLVAVDILAKENVSLVISDVMMPEMNGYELCKRIKSDIVFSHIPVILLTALSDDKQRMYGIASGADEFIQKPFNIEEVKLRIVRLLEERARLRNAFAQELQSPAASGLKTDKAESMDELFMRKFMALIEESYPDSNFSIEKASEMLGLSRVHLYRKVKELTGVTPTDFLRNYRLKQAAALLRQKDCNVNEAAYATGFSSPPYFSKCFKAVYNITPTEYQEKG